MAVSREMVPADGTVCPLTRLELRHVPLDEGSSRKCYRLRRARKSERRGAESIAIAGVRLARRMAARYDGVSTPRAGERLAG
jgi:hypothetical protein